jgi:hypothetical protein
MRVSLTLDHQTPLVDAPEEQSLTGIFVSSLFRLKDGDNYEGGFFIFGGRLPVKIQGTFRRESNPYEMLPDQARFQCSVLLSAIPFRCRSQKTQGAECAGLLWIG